MDAIGRPERLEDFCGAVRRSVVGDEDVIDPRVEVVSQVYGQDVPLVAHHHHTDNHA